MANPQQADKEAIGRQTTVEIYHRLQKMGIFPELPQSQLLPNSPELRVSIPKINDSGLTEGQLAAHLGEDLHRFKQNEESAEKNSRYYQEQAVKTGRPWLHCVKQKNQYSEFVLITPEMAKEALEWNNNPRKRIKRLQIESYARDMRHGRWIQTSESIDVDHRGYIFNGQHRLNSVIVAERPVVFYMTFNCQVEARYPVDSGVKRSTTEKISLVLDNPIGTKLTAICRAMMRGTKAQMTKFSDSEITDFALKYKGVIEWVTKTCPGHRADVQAAFAKAILWYGSEKMQPFIKRFADVMFTSKDDPARRLYEFTLSSKHGGVTAWTTYCKTLAAIHHYVNNKEIRALYEREKDIFEWGPNWSMPPKSDDEPAE